MQELIWDGGRNRNFSFSFVFEKYLPFKENALHFQIFFFFFKHNISQSKEKLPNQDLAWIFSR